MDEFEVVVDGGKLFGVEQGEGLPVVFLHAGVCDHRMWRAQFEELGDGVHSIAYDRRGFGKSISDNVEFSALDDLEAVLSHLGIRSAIFVGCSQGGRLAIDFALKHPDRAAGLVLVSSSVSGAPKPDLPLEYDPIMMALDHADELDDLEQINKIEAHMWLDGPLQKGGRVSGDLRQLFLDMNGKALAHPDLDLEIEKNDAWDRLHEIAAPTLLVCGNLDFEHIQERHAILAEELENSAEVLIEGTAHVLSMERPDLFNPLLAEFLSAY